VSAAHETFAARRATLVAQASAERETLARKLAPLAALDRAIEKLHTWKSQLPMIASGAGLALSALLLALPTGRFPLVRGGVALLNLAGSVRSLFSRR
jgi:transposase